MMSVLSAFIAGHKTGFFVAYYVAVIIAFALICWSDGRGHTEPL